MCFHGNAKRKLFFHSGNEPVSSATLGFFRRLVEGDSWKKQTARRRFLSAVALALFRREHSRRFIFPSNEVSSFPSDSRVLPRRSPWLFGRFRLSSCLSPEEWTKRSRRRRRSGWTNPAGGRARIPSRTPKSPRWPSWRRRKTSTWRPKRCRTPTTPSRLSQARATSSELAEWRSKSKKIAPTSCF